MIDASRDLTVTLVRSGGNIQGYESIQQMMLDLFKELSLDDMDAMMDQFLILHEDAVVMSTGDSNA